MTFKELKCNDVFIFPGIDRYQVKHCEGSYKSILKDGFSASKPCDDNADVILVERNSQHEIKYTLSIDEAIEKLVKLREQLGGESVLILRMPNDEIYTNVTDLVVATADDDPKNQWVDVIVR